MTTTQLRKTDFELVVAPGMDGQASGSLYFDDGVSIAPKSTTQVNFGFARGKLTVTGKFGFAMGVEVARVRFLGVQHAPDAVELNGKVKGGSFTYDGTSKVLIVNVGAAFKEGFSVAYS